MSSHLFGATSSPGYANVGLRKAADDDEDECCREIADFIRNNFYVDGDLKSVSSPSNSIKKTRSLCKKGEFRLHKIIWSSQELVNAVPPEKREWSKRFCFKAGRASC